MTYDLIIFDNLLIRADYLNYLATSMILLSRHLKYIILLSNLAHISILSFCKKKNFAIVKYKTYMLWLDIAI